MNIVILISLFSCEKKNEDKNSEKSVIKFEILNNEINALNADATISFAERLDYLNIESQIAKNVITYKITNISDTNYFFVLDEDRIEYDAYNVFKNLSIDSCSYCKKSKLFFNLISTNHERPKYFSIQNSNLKLLEKKVITKSFIEQEIKFKIEDLNIPVIDNDIDFLNSIRKNSFILHPNESRYFIVALYLPIDREANQYNEIVSYFEFNKKQNYNFSLFYVADSLTIKKALPNYILKQLQENKVKIFNGIIESNTVPIKFISVQNKQSVR